MGGDMTGDTGGLGGCSESLANALGLQSDDLIIIMGDV